MRTPSPHAIPSLVLVPRAEAGSPEPVGGDGTLLVWDADPAGIFAALQQAERTQRAVLPARWFPARNARDGGVGDDARILWMARGDRALAQLLAPHDDGPARIGDTARPDEPVALLGVPGDVVTTPEDNDPHELVRRAELWIQKLGFDRVALAIPASAGAAHPLAELAARRQLGVVRVGTAEDRMPPSDPSAPLLWTSFQLDGEHRLPDDDFVPGLRDLLHRGSLLRERTLYDRLPEDVRQQIETELRALMAWHVSPFLRRAGSLLQTLMPVAGVEWQVPLGVRSWTGYLLGLCEKPHPRDAHEIADAAVDDARRLVQALQSWDRAVRADVTPGSWTQLRHRLAPWAEGGHLAGCDAMEETRRGFCFSGQPLWNRAPLRRGVDGISTVALDPRDRRALGWFSLELTSVRGRTAPGVTEAGATVTAFPFRDASDEDQLPLGLEGTGA